MEKQLKIDSIVVQNRHRKLFGDLKGLAHSIKTVGLLQAIGVTKKDSRLIFGERRLKACRLNGDKTIDCRLLDIKDILEAEHAENEFRANLTLTEKHALAEELAAQAPKRQGGDRKSSKANQAGPPGLLDRGQTRDHIAVKAGFGSQQEMQRVNTVMKKGTTELIEAMDKGKVAVTTAATIAQEPKKRQKEILSEHRGKSGKIQPKGLAKSQAVLFMERMDGVLRKAWGVKEQFGGVKEMMESPLWVTSTAKEKKKCIFKTIDAASELTKLAQSMKSYGKQKFKLGE